jgi:hypothetical protein
MSLDIGIAFENLPPAKRGVTDTIIDQGESFKVTLSKNQVYILECKRAPIIWLLEELGLENNLVTYKRKPD